MTDHPGNTADLVPDVLRHFRQFKHGLLADGDLRTKVRYVVDPRTGQMTLPLASAPVEDGLTLAVPDESADAMQLLVELAELDTSREDLCDRWHIYHGQPNVSRWFTIRVDSVKWSGQVFDGAQITATSPLMGVEARMCKKANSDKPRLAAMCQRHVRTSPAEPLVVGIDQDGIDLRARFGIIRVEFAKRAMDANHAESMLDAMLNGDR